MSEESGSANLEKVDHVVVLMLENRSFDHMLGYLSLECGRPDIDGLRPRFSNEHDGRAYPIHHLDTTAIADDPDHCADAVDLQLGDGAMNGFVRELREDAIGPRRAGRRRGERDGIPQRRGSAGLRSPRERVRGLRSLVQLGSRRDVAQPTVCGIWWRGGQPR